MQNILRKIPEDRRRARAWLFSVILIVLISFIMILGSGGDVDTDSILSIDPVMLLIFQGVTSLIIFVGLPLIFIYVILQIKLGEFFPKISWTATGYAVLITICSIVIISAIGEWNMNLDFGDSDFAKWAKNSEEQLKVLTEHFTDFTSPIHFILGLIVIALIPAIGEELLFRGLIQNNLTVALKNHHVSIWLTGFIFAAIHLQFFGLAPRMLLGVLFGYLYHWSGNLTVAMLAHFINNGLQIVLMYLVKLEVFEMSPEQMEEAAPWPALVIFGALGIFLVLNFKKSYSLAHE